MKETPLFRFITAGFLSFLKFFLKFRFPKNLTNIQIAPITTAIPILYKNTLPYPPILGSKTDMDTNLRLDHELSYIQRKNGNKSQLEACFQEIFLFGGFNIQSKSMAIGMI